MKTRIDTSSFFIFLLSLSTPIFVNHKTLNIYGDLFSAINLWDKEYLIIAFFKLVFLNTIRCIPIYLFIFIFIQSILPKLKIKNEKLTLFSIVIFFPLLIYKILNVLFSLNLTGGASYFLSILWLGFYIYSNPFSLKTFEKYLILLLFFVGIQWLDFLSIFKIFGSGEITAELKSVTEFMNAETIITIISILFGILFISSSTLALYFFKRDELYKKQIEINSENRYHKEVKFLAHDLKTPLFSIASLIELLEMKSKDDDQIYFTKLKSILDKTNLFINEILDSDSKSIFSIKDLHNFIYSFLSTHNKNFMLHNFDYTFSNPHIEGNKIALSRALINLIVNSWEANATKVNFITKEYGSTLLLCIEDNGDGFNKKILNKLFSKNISSKNSSGLGLIFVKNVIENIGGNIFILSNCHNTRIFIKLKKEKL